MAESVTTQGAKAVFTDTTILVEREIGVDPELATAIADMFSRSEFKLACAYSRLEYKRVVIQNLCLTLDYLCEEKLFTRAMVRANSLQRQRRVRTLVNISIWLLGRIVNQQVELPAEKDQDELLAERGIAYLRNAIRSAWRKFELGVDCVTNALNCQRAGEKPRQKASGGFDATVHESACKNKGCNIAPFFQSHFQVLKKLQRFLIKMKPELLTEELRKASETIEKALVSPVKLYDYDTCLRMADIWIHLECLFAGAKKLWTTNYKESQVLCSAFGLEMVDANRFRRRLQDKQGGEPQP